MKKAVYTVVTGNYDIVEPPINKNPDWEYILFKNHHNISNESNWDRVIDFKNDEGLNKKLLSRKPKIMPHLYLDHDFTIYQDANLQLKTDPELLYKSFGNADMILGKHPLRNCIYRELKANIKYKKENEDRVNRIERLLRQSGYPENNGLAANGLLLRHNNERVNSMMEHWWSMLKEYSHRDQLTFMLVRYKTPNVNVRLINALAYNKKVYRKLPHKK